MDEVFVSHAQKFFCSLASALLSIAACSKQQPTHNADTGANAPLVQTAAVDPMTTPVTTPGTTAGEEFRGSFAPGGIKASYRASFVDDHIVRLEETRKASGATASYEFRGARLMKYRGAALDSTQHVELEFDANGRLLVARAGDSEPNDEQIAAIRDRAQSLRSHAVAQHAVRGHDRN